MLKFDPQHHAGLQLDLNVILGHFLDGRRHRRLAQHDPDTLIHFQIGGIDLHQRRIGNDCLGCGLGLRGRLGLGRGRRGRRDGLHGGGGRLGLAHGRGGCLGLGLGLLHELPDQAAMVRPLCPTRQILAASEVSEVLDWAFATMATGRPGPVHIEVPTDVMPLDCEALPAPAALPVAAMPDLGAAVAGFAAAACRV